MFLPVIAALMLQAPVDVSNQVGFQLTSMALTSGGTLATTDLTDDIAQLNVTNSAGLTSNSAAATATFAITWSPTSVGEVAPSSLIVTVARNYKLSATGNGTSTLKDASNNVIDTLNGTDTFMNGQIGIEDEAIYTVSLTTQADGTALGTLTVPTNVVACTYDSTGGLATTATENIVLTEFDRPATMLTARTAKAVKVAMNRTKKGGIR